MIMDEIQISGDIKLRYDHLVYFIFCGCLFIEVISGGMIGFMGTVFIPFIQNNYPLQNQCYQNTFGNDQSLLTLNSTSNSTTCITLFFENIKPALQTYVIIGFGLMSIVIGFLVSQGIMVWLNFVVSQKNKDKEVKEQSSIM